MILSAALPVNTTSVVAAGTAAAPDIMGTNSTGADGFSNELQQTINSFRQSDEITAVEEPLVQPQADGTVTENSSVLDKQMLEEMYRKMTGYAQGEFMAFTGSIDNQIAVKSSYDEAEIAVDAVSQQVVDLSQTENTGYIENSEMPDVLQQSEKAEFVLPEKTAPQIRFPKRTDRNADMAADTFATLNDKTSQMPTDNETRDVRVEQTVTYAQSEHTVTHAQSEQTVKYVESEQAVTIAAQAIADSNQPDAIVTQTKADIRQADAIVTQTNEAIRQADIITEPINAEIKQADANVRLADSEIVQTDIDGIEQPRMSERAEPIESTVAVIDGKTVQTADFTAQTDSVQLTDKLQQAKQADVNYTMPDFSEAAEFTAHPIQTAQTVQQYVGREDAVIIRNPAVRQKQPKQESAINTAEKEIVISTDALQAAVKELSYGEQTEAFEKIDFAVRTEAVQAEPTKNSAGDSASQAHSSTVQTAQAAETEHSETQPFALKAEKSYDFTANIETAKADIENSPEISDQKTDIMQSVERQSVLRRISEKTDELGELTKTAETEKSADKSETADNDGADNAKVDTFAYADKSQVFTEKADKPQTILRMTVNEVYQLIAEKSSGAKKTEFTVVLTPENLGKITVKMANENGKLSVEIIAETKAAKQLFETNAERLVDNLRQNDVYIQSYKVASDEGQLFNDSFDGSSKNPYRQNKDSHTEQDGDEVFADLFDQIVNMD